MPHRETTIEAWTLPNLGAAFERKFALTGYVSERSFTIDYSAGGGGSLSVAREFPRFDEFVHVDSTNHANDVGSIVRINKDGAPVTHYLARRFEDNVDPKATKLPVTLQSMDFFLDRAGVAPYDHDPLDPANSPNPTLDPDWEYGAESILRTLGNEFANEVQRIWRGSGVTMGTFTLTDGVSTTDPIAWNATAGTIRTRLETDIASITNVIVRGDGALKTPWEVEFTDPAGDIAYTLAVTNNTTDGVFSVDTTRNGGTLDPSPWHRSYNAVTKTEHGNYQAFEVLHRDDVPAGLQAASTDEYFLRIDLDDVNDPQDYGGAQVIANVAPGSVYRASVPVYVPGASYGFRLVLRHLDEAHIANGGDIQVPADTLTTLNIDPFKMGDNTNEIVYRVGILENTNITEVYIAYQSAVLAPGFDEEYLGKIMNDLLVPINARGLLTWVTPTWTDTLDSAGNVWDQKLQWTISHRQSILQLVEFAKEWGYESSGIYWSEANSRFQWDLFNPGGGGAVITDYTIVTGDIEGASPVMHRLPGASSSWAFGRNGAWGRYEDADLLATVGRLEVMDLDRQSRDNLAIHAQERINAEKESASGQRLRLRTDRFTVFVDMSPGDFVEVNLGPRFINAVYRIAGVTDAVDEDGNEYQEVHIGTLVKSASTAETDTVRELYRKFESLGESRDRGGVVDPTQQVIPASGDQPYIFIAASNAPAQWIEMAHYKCDGIDDYQNFFDAWTQAIAEGKGIWMSPGIFNIVDQGGTTHFKMPVIPNGMEIRGCGADLTQVQLDEVSAGSYTNTDPANGWFISDTIGSWIHEFSIWDVTFFDGHITGMWIGESTRVEGMIISTSGHGIRIGGQNSFVVNNHMSGGGRGSTTGDDAAVFVDGLMMGTVISGNVVTSWAAGRACINVYETSFFQFINGGIISDNVITETVSGRGISLQALSGGGWGWVVSGNSLEVTGFVSVAGNTHACIFVDGFEQTIIANNNISNDDSGFNDNWGAIHIFESGLNGPVVVTGNNLNRIVNNGIRVEDSYNVKIADNYIHEAGSDGILIVDSDGVTVENNTTVNCCYNADNTYDLIAVTGTCPRIVVTGNVYYRVPIVSGIPRYGINIATAGVANAFVVSNYLGDDAAYGTSPTNDAGTSTQWTYPGGAHGDNYTY